LRELYLSAAVRSSVSLAPLDDCPEVKIEEMKSLLGKEQYLVGVRKLKEHIGCGDIFQAVLSDRFTATFDGDPGDLFNVLSRLSPSPYQFYFPLNKKTFLGASPEMLLRIHGDTLETHPIAGTRRRGKTSEEDLSLELELMDDMKEKAEHIMLVDLARNDIGRVSKSGTVRVDSFMKTRRFSSVMHLVSRVLGDKKEGISSIEALAACFPAGTLSGAPKIRAMQLISELEPEPRNVYGGAMVAASFTGDLDSCIAIRSLEVGNGQVTLQVGAGIVADSIPEIEYEEVQHKSQMVRKALALANQNKMRIKSTFDSKVGEK